MLPNSSQVITTQDILNERLIQNANGVINLAQEPVVYFGALAKYVEDNPESGVASITPENYVINSADYLAGRVNYLITNGPWVYVDPYADPPPPSSMQVRPATSGSTHGWIDGSLGAASDPTKTDLNFDLHFRQVVQASYKLNSIFWSDTGGYGRIVYTYTGGTSQVIATNAAPTRCSVEIETKKQEGSDGGLGIAGPEYATYNFIPNSVTLAGSTLILQTSNAAFGTFIKAVIGNTEEVYIRVGTPTIST